MTIDPRTPSWTLIHGDALKAHQRIEPGTVAMAGTSPPYFGLRIYDGVPGLGNEATPEEYVQNLADILDETKDALHKTGTLWLNLGDSYNGSGGAGGDYGPGGKREGQPKYPGRKLEGMKDKDLIGVPWMVAFELRRRGWFLRGENIWVKPNPQPEGPSDRCAREHETVFLLAKSAKPSFDWWRVMEPTVSGDGRRRWRSAWEVDYDLADAVPWESVQNERTSTYKGAHFATFPVALVTPWIRAGTPEAGVCAECFAPVQRILEKRGQTAYERHGGTEEWKGWKGESQTDGKAAQQSHVGGVRTASGSTPDLSGPEYVHAGWKRPCRHLDAPLVPPRVLDPFCGAATMGVAALEEGCSFIGIEKVADYVDLSEERLRKLGPLGRNGQIISAEAAHS